MTESLDQFMNRIYTDFTRDKVWVYGDKRHLGKPQVWSVDKAKEYVRYLDGNQDG